MFLQYNVGQSGGKSGLDIKVLPAWIQGYTGKGVVVSIVDDGNYYTRLHNTFSGTLNNGHTRNIVLPSDLK